MLGSCSLSAHATIKPPRWQEKYSETLKVLINPSKYCEVFSEVSHCAGNMLRGICTAQALYRAAPPLRTHIPRRGYTASRRVFTACPCVLWLVPACVYILRVGYILRRHLHRSTTPTRAQYMCGIIRPACVYGKGLP